VASDRLRARSRAALVSGPTLAAFREPGYPALWLSGAASAFGMAVGLVAIGWLALEVSNSALAVGATFAARFVPSLLLGIPLGGVVDRFDRRKTMVAVYFVGALPLVAAAALAANGLLGLAALLGLSLVLGVFDTIRGTASQSYAFDLTGPDGATNAIALGHLGSFLLGFVGSISGGLALEQFGAGTAFLLAAGMSVLAGVILAVGGRQAGRAQEAPREAPSFRRSITLISRNRLVALIALVVIIGEVFGFSSLTVYPTFARDVLHSDATGLGALAAARNIGAAVGMLLLARLGVGGRGGRLLLSAAFGLGFGLVCFALSSSFALSLVLLLGVGAAAAALDTLGQSLIQRSVDDNERGSAMGVWFFAIGFGPVGHLGLGAAAAAIGAPTALAISGGLLAITAAALSRVRAIRRLA
jgi:MFS family permease